MNIAIFGGSFDPIHTGHAIVANYISQLQDIDEVWLMVSPRNPMKTQSPSADFNHRLEMCRVVARRSAKIKASDFEASLVPPLYTINTLRELKRKYPEHEFSLIIGADNLKIFHNWKDSQELINEFGVIVYPRPGFTLSGEEEKFRLIRECPECDLSSTKIKKMIAEGKNINFMVPCEVAEYINKHHLYE